MKPVDLEAIRERIECPSAVQAVRIGEYETCARAIVEHDAPALVAEVERLRAVADEARSVDVLLPSPSNIDVKHRDQLTTAMVRLGAALDALDAGGEG